MYNLLRGVAAVLAAWAAGAVGEEQPPDMRVEVQGADAEGSMYESLETTIHFLTGGEGDEAVSTVKAVCRTICYPCQKRGKRLRKRPKADCWHCTNWREDPATLLDEAAREELAATSPSLQATFWPGCDPRETGGACAGKSVPIDTVFRKDFQLTTFKPDDWDEADREVFTAAVQKSLRPHLEALAEETEL
eukprot:TRINITY_DN802_c0_g3_i1.p1 TRINITY_DN802_c0_g3~~TRINITY_DN802_c0_g3_i1.p1  ORF type:complete len:191 (+),score=72.36 TRINITY_DN802_c0_g3_i1:46-618(+)